MKCTGENFQNYTSCNLKLNLLIIDYELVRYWLFLNDWIVRNNIYSLKHMSQYFFPNSVVNAYEFKIYIEREKENAILSCYFKKESYKNIF